MEATISYIGVVLGYWKIKWKLLYSIVGLYWGNGK